MWNSWPPGTVRLATALTLSLAICCRSDYIIGFVTPAIRVRTHTGYSTPNTRQSLNETITCFLWSHVGPTLFFIQCWSESGLVSPCSGESESTRPESESESIRPESESIRCESESIGPESESSGSEAESESNKSQCEPGLESRLSLDSESNSRKVFYFNPTSNNFCWMVLYIDFWYSQPKFPSFCTDIQRLTARNMYMIYRLKP